MFNKKNQEMFQKSLANSFNQKKTIENDLTRFKNISQNKVNRIVHLNIDKHNIDNTEFFYNNKDKYYNNNNNNNIYNMKNIRTSSHVQLNMKNMKNNDDNITIPKVVLKDIVIPTYSFTDNYDISSINKNINKPIEMDIFDNENRFNGDINILYRRKVRKINNIYQESYAENIKPTGFGDFIRGCFFLLQFCSKYNFQIKIIINHPVASFLENFYQQYSLYENVNNPFLKLTHMFVENNWKISKYDSSNYITDVVTNNKTFDDFLNYLCNLKVFQGAIFSYNIMFPYDEISEEHKIYMRNLLEPNEEIKLYVDNTLETIGFHKKSYSVIHVRSGDKYLNENTKIFDSVYYKKLVHEINILIHSNPKNNYLLIADNIEIKILLIEKFPSLKAVFKNITHLGEGTLLEREKVKNTMLDFYLMSHCNSIYSYTCYAHGSGFSYWCAKTYNIHHKCMYINIK